MNGKKPDYIIPSMAEIRAIPWNGYNVVSTFSGCGGSCLGYRMAGYRVLYANEFIEAAQKVYKLNHPNSYLDCRDIRKVKPEEILEKINLKKGELDLYDGSPPCSQFSVAGNTNKGWGKIKQYSDKKQRVDDLFFEYCRILTGLQPKVFVAENVTGLVKGVAKGYFKEILQALKDCDYNVKAFALNAAFLGVPQSRERIIFIGVRKDLDLAPIHPKPLDYYYTVKDVLPWILKVKHSGKPFNYKPSNTPSPTITQSDAITKESAYFSGGGWIKTASETRKFTINELKKICAFPDDFILTGTFEQQWERLGRAVPPVMMEKVAKTIQTEILDKL